MVTKMMICTHVAQPVSDSRPLSTHVCLSFATNYGTVCMHTAPMPLPPDHAQLSCCRDRNARTLLAVLKAAGQAVLALICTLCGRQAQD